MSQRERDVFPRHDDRVVIKAFLAGKKPKHPTPGATVVLGTGNSLAFQNSSVIAWFDTAGALCAKLASGGRERPASRLAINYIWDIMVGDGSRAIEREVSSPLPGQDLARQRYFFAGAAVAIDQPIVLVGPVGVLAYRAVLRPE